MKSNEEDFAITKTIDKIVSRVRASDTEAPPPRKVSMKIFDDARIPLRHLKFDRLTNTSEDWANGLENLISVFRGGGIALIIGNRGVGKTQMVVSAFRTLLKEANKERPSYDEICNCRYYKAMDIFLRIREAMKDSDDSERKALKEFTTVRNLAIDAYEVRGDTAFEGRIIDHIIDVRYDMNYGTAIITNEEKSVAYKRLGESVMDRIMDDGAIIEMLGESFRGAV